MKNYFYCEAIGNRIKDLLDQNLTAECAKNITTGDFSVLPEPEMLTGYLPAVIIDSEFLDVESANQNLEIYYMPYKFSIYYLYPYDFKEMADIPKQAKINAQMVANVLMGDKTLEEFKIDSSQDEAGGWVVDSSIHRITFDNAETKLFRAIDIPMSIAKIDLEVGFRTYERS